MPPQKINDEECEQNRGSYEVCFDDDYDNLQHLKKASGPYILISKLTFSTCNRREEKEETLIILGCAINLP